MRVAEIAATLVVVGVAVGAVALEPLRRRFAQHPTEEECARLLDRYVEHVVYAADPKPAASVLDERRARARSLAAADPEFASCPTTLTRREADCAAKAQNADEFERCLP